MKQRSLARIWITTAILFAVALLVKTASFFPLWIEQKYSTGIYPFIASFLRALFGWLPVSIGDLLYAFVVIWLLVKCLKTIIALFKKRVTKRSFFSGLGMMIQFFLAVYIWFNLLWGLNYDRLGIGYQLQLKPRNYTTEELKTLTNKIIVKANDTRIALNDAEVIYPPYRQIFSESIKSYDALKTSPPFLKYKNSCIKRSLYGRMGNYLGFLGYYNPFTGEAQVNVTPPAFLLPFVTCHEMAHQLGYGTEDEANFVSYLAAKNSPYKLFHYSVYFELFAYANGELFQRDSVAARANYKLLDTLVRKDISTYRQFLKAHKNPVEPYITAFYSAYLKANNQPKGIDTYSDVLALLIAYQKKYGVL